MSRTSIIREFSRAVVTPSMTAVIVALAVTVLFCILFLTQTTPRAMAMYGDRVLAVSPWDYDLGTTTRVLRLQQRPDPSRLLVVLGASTTRHSLLETDLASALESSGLGDIEVLKLCISAQSLWHSFTLLGSLPREERGVVVLGMGPVNMARNPSDLGDASLIYRLGLRSASADEYLRSKGVAVRHSWVDMYALDNFDFLFTRIRRHAVVNNLITGQPPILQESRYLNTESLPRERRRGKAEVMAQILGHYQENYAENFQLLEAIRNEVESREGMSLVLYEPPASPWFIEEYNLAELYQSYRRDMRSYAALHDLLFIEANKLADVEEPHFRDWGHLSSGLVANKMSTELINSIAPLF